ncbi:MAG: hypothetical protein WB767_03125 [Nocardioides sp.]
MTVTLKHPLPLLVPALVAVLAAGCGTGDAAKREPTSSTQPTTFSSPATVPSGPRAVDDPDPRLAISHEGGVSVVSALDGTVISTIAMPGFVRLNAGGDGRHVIVSADGGFRALDVGAWTVDHGDHEHAYVGEPGLTDFEVAATEPGHVVVHEGITTLFDDGSGTVTAFDSIDLDHPDGPDLVSYQASDPHHGVAAHGRDGTWLLTVGTTEARTGVALVDDAGATLATSKDCPGVHGEAFAGDVAVFGCEDGVLVVDGRRISKISAPDPYGRIGNQAGADNSPYVLGDYKSDAETELERPTRVSVIDTRDATMRLVEIGASYTFRSLGRMPDGDGLVLGTDGSLHVIDAEKARVTRRLPVLDQWREPADWQAPRPTLEVVGDTAFVTDPAARRIYVVDLSDLTVRTSFSVDVVPQEMVGVTG